MSSTTESTLLATIIDMNTRLANMETKVKHLVSHSSNRERYTNNGRTMNTSVPLHTHSHNHTQYSDDIVPMATDTSTMRHRRPYQQQGGYHQGHQQQGHQQQGHQQRQYNRNQEDEKVPFVPIDLSELLNKDEEVLFQVIIGKEENGNLKFTTAEAVFNGVEFDVTRCELVPALVGVKSSKPGEVLYKLIDGLKESGYLQRKFSVAPWKLCSVLRNGLRVTLDQLRASKK